MSACGSTGKAIFRVILHDLDTNSEIIVNDIELIINHKLMQTVTEIDVVNAEWVGKRTNLKQKFDGKYVMEWGF